MLFANFLHGGDKDLLNKPLQTLIEEAVEDSEQFEAEFARDGDDDAVASGISLQDGDSFDLTVVVEDFDTGDEVELPTIHVKRRKPAARDDGSR